jgi:hypothetical protein
MYSKLAKRALFGLVPLLLLAQSALAQDTPLSDRYRIAEKLGSGAFKDVYAVEGHPELALGIFERNEHGGWGDKTNLLQEEKAMLDKIASKGVPTATILEISTYDGKKAYLQKRFETANRAPDWQQKRWEVLNQTSIDDCEKIEAALKSGKLNVSDAQFLIGKDGHVVLSDPLSVTDLTDAPNQSSAKSVLDNIERAAHEAIDARSAKLLAAMPDAQDPALQQYFAQAKVALQWNDQAGEAALKEALLHYLESGDSTPESREVAKSIRDGTFEVEFLHQKTQAPQKPDAIKVVADGLFPRIARDLVLEGWKKIHETTDALEVDVLAAAHALDFLFAKKVPAEVRGTPDREATPDQSARPARTSGMSGLLGEAVQDGSADARGDGAARDGR